MRECPKCGYRDGIYWWPRIFDPGVDFAKFEDIEKSDPILGAKLKNLTWGKGRSILVEGPYVYRVTKSAVVHRIEKFLFDAQDGFSVGTDGAGSPNSALYKKRVSFQRGAGRQENLEQRVSRQFAWIRAQVAKEQQKLSLDSDRKRV